jgi:hypothetical protein
VAALLPELHVLFSSNGPSTSGRLPLSTDLNSSARRPDRTGAQRPRQSRSGRDERHHRGARVSGLLDGDGAGGERIDAQRGRQGKGVGVAPPCLRCRTALSPKRPPRRTSPLPVPLPTASERGSRPGEKKGEAVPEPANGQLRLSEEDGVGCCPVSLLCVSVRCALLPALLFLLFSLRSGTRCWSAAAAAVLFLFRPVLSAPCPVNPAPAQRRERRNEQHNRNEQTQVLIRRRRTVWCPLQLPISFVSCATSLWIRTNY